MIVLEKKVKGKREELLKKARLFFGPEGEGLTETALHILKLTPSFLSTTFSNLSTKESGSIV
jgi:hypothetical protein